MINISAHDNVRSSDNFRPIRACDRLCAIMVGQNVRARDNARIINYIAYWPAVPLRGACVDNYFTLGGIQQHYSYLGPGYWERQYGCNHMVFINSPLGLHNILLAKCSPRPLFWFPGYIVK